MCRRERDGKEQHGKQQVFSAKILILQSVQPFPACTNSFLYYFSSILLEKNLITSRLMADVVQWPTFS